MGTGVPAHHPHDAYMLYILPTKGPIIGVPLDIVLIRQAGALHPRDTSAAEVAETIRQLAADVRLRRVDLQRNRTLLAEMLKFMGRIARVNGMVYPAPGETPDPYEDAKKQVEDFRTKFAEQREDDSRRAEKIKQDALARQRKEHEGDLKALHGQYSDLMAKAFRQRDEAFDIAKKANTELAEAQLRAIAAQHSAGFAAAPQADLEAEERIGELERHLERFRDERDRLNEQLTAAADQYVEIRELQEKIKRMEAQEAQEAQKAAERSALDDATTILSDRDWM